MIARRPCGRRSGAIVHDDIGLAALLSACTAPPALTTPVGEMPDLRGTWTGTWGGTPLTLVVLEQRDAEAFDGVSVGSWQVFGRNLPARGRHPDCQDPE